MRCTRPSRESLQSSETSFLCARADDLTGGGHIIENILKGIAEFELIIADLTGRNPNVFYELGIVHMVKDVEKVILLSQDTESIPFDLRVLRCIQYVQAIRGARDLRRELVSAVQSIADKFFRFRLESSQSYMFGHRLVGKDRRAYNFTISHALYAIDAVKFVIALTTQSAGKTPVVSYEDTVYLPREGIFALPGLDWALELEQSQPEGANLLLRRHQGS